MHDRRLSAFWKQEIDKDKGLESCINSNSLSLSSLLPGNHILQDVHTDTRQNQ